MKTISLIVGLKNNLDYTKNFYTTTRSVYPDIEICFASYGSTDGTNEWLTEISKTDSNVRVFISTESATFSDTFNTAVNLATSEYVALLHNDMVLASDFIENILKYATSNRVIGYTTIEPPVFADHDRPGKIIHPLGYGLTDFNVVDFYETAILLKNQYRDMVSLGVAFFMCLPTTVYKEMGGMDPIFKPMFCEDDDFILRLQERGMDCMTSLDALCYHFVSKTSRFSDEFASSSQLHEINSSKNFIRKWGFRLPSKHKKTYDIAFKITNCKYITLSLLEPWCKAMYTDAGEANTFSYIAYEQDNTSYNLNDRLRDISTVGFFEHDIIISFDASKFNQTSYDIIQNISDIITESGEVGEFELDIFKIKINKLQTYNDKLVNKSYNVPAMVK